MERAKELDETHIQDDSHSPTKFSKTENILSERKEKASNHNQSEIIDERILKLQRKIESQKRDEVKMVVTFFILLILGYIIVSHQYMIKIDDFGRQMQALQSKQLEWKKEATYFQKTITDMRQQIDILHRYTQKLENEIVDIYMNQLAQPEKHFNILMKFSNQLQIELGDALNHQNQRSNKANYKYLDKEKTKIRKSTNEETMAYSEEAIPNQQIWHFQIKIEQTQLGMIAIGIFTEGKDKNCGYCQSDKMYYIYCKNGYIYHGQSLQFYKSSKQSKFDSIKQGDTVAIFYDNNRNEVIWYVNNKFAGAEFLEQADINQKLHPFVLMNSRGDQIEIVK